MNKETLDITDLGEIAYEVDQAKNMLVILSDILERVQPKNDNVQLIDHEEAMRIVGNTYNDYEKWNTLLYSAIEKLTSQIERLDNAQ